MDHQQPAKERDERQETNHHHHYQQPQHTDTAATAGRHLGCHPQGSGAQQSSRGAAPSAPTARSLAALVLLLLLALALLRWVRTGWGGLGQTDTPTDRSQPAPSDKTPPNRLPTSLERPQPNPTDNHQPTCIDMASAIASSASIGSAPAAGAAAAAAAGAAAGSSVCARLVVVLVWNIVNERPAAGHDHPNPTATIYEIMTNSQP
jgi:hypothetical protein